MPDFQDHPDFMARSSSLRRHGLSRTTYDPNNPSHQASLAKFIETGNWGDVQFFPEYPFTDVPMTVLMKQAAHSLACSSRIIAQ